MVKSKLTKEERAEIKHNNFLLRIEDTFPNEYTVLGKFKNVGTKVLIQHKFCDYKWEVYPSNLFSGKSKCPNCSGKIHLTTEQFKKKVSLIDETFEVIGEYINASTKVRIKHTICNYEWDIRPHHLTSTKVKCPRCQNRERYTTEDFKTLLEKTTDREYTTTDKYINNRTLMNFQHVLCGKIFEESPINILYSYASCPECKDSLSRGERKIHDYLSDMKILFRQQQTLPDCVDVHALRFDFSIVDNDNIVALIEFDGGQHFEPIEWFGGDESFRKQQRRDNIKNIYCKENSIPLLRIPYWEESNINSILEEFLSSLNSK